MADMIWTSGSADQGQYLSLGKLSKKFQTVAQPMLRFKQFVSTKNALGKHEGESFNWLKITDVNTIGGKLTETNTMHVTDQTLSHGTMTITEYGNSIPLTRKIETLSEFDIWQIVREGLMNDYARVQDGLIEREFNSCVLRGVGSSTATLILTTNGTAVASNTSVLNSYQIRNLLLQLKKRNVPGWAAADGDYAGILSVEAMDSVLSAMETINSYTESGYNKILNGEMGRLYGCRLVEDSGASRNTYDSTARTWTAVSWAQSQSGPAYFFGKPTIVEGVAVPVEVRKKEVTDYGRSNGLGWYMLCGYRIEWGDAAADQANCRIIKWDSAG